MQLFKAGTYYPFDVEIGKRNLLNDLHREIGDVPYEFVISDTRNHDDPKDKARYKLVELFYEE